MKYAVTCFGLNSIGIEAVSKAEAVEKYETLRGLTKGINPVVAVAIDGEPEEVLESPFGLTRSDRYEPYVKPEPETIKLPEVVKKAFPDLVPESEAAEELVVGEEVLVGQ